MYSPADRPSRTRAAPAKKRIWSTLGGSSSLAVSPSGLPVSCDSDAHELVGPLLEGVRDLEQRLLALGRAWSRPTSSNALAAAP